MRTRWIFPTALLLFSLTQATMASAQDGSQPQPTGRADSSTKTAAPSPESAIDVSQLPINLDRIQRQLRRQSTVRDESEGLNLRYVVDVFGQAPRIELFPNRDYSLSGPAPYGAPTHQEMLRVMTPQEFSAPAANLGNLFRWFSDKAKDK